MAMTTEQVLKVSTLDAVKNVTDLKNNISELKRVINGWTETTEEDGKKVVKTFEGLSIGSKEYQQAIKQLNENQAALRNAMHGTAASLDAVTTIIFPRPPIFFFVTSRKVSTIIAAFC